MGRQATRVYTSPEDIARLERCVERLAVNAWVRIALRDGDAVEGMVTVTPTVQMFYDVDGNEGVNGVVTLEDVRRPDWRGDVWLGDIAAVEHLDSVVRGVSRA
ncbi:DUF3247 family protein [Fulvimonas sp. R45]|uniref:DUF3247 family protein n=1 Tax=Fulvimonas sp. R45 TaxID=3045937 RepID=UPI00265E643C|nr:DUF3247 family protein [Fulvimonas sp. R45]MDO1528802.1 DUF3247 family protein [Fulvimonas sp. R45]